MDKTKQAIGFVMDYKTDNDTTKYYIKYLQSKILETKKLRKELREKGLKLIDVSKDVYDEYSNCVSCLTFRSHHDKINHLKFFEYDDR